MFNRKAFTLLEVLISIALMGIVIVALFSAVDMLQNSNQQLFKYLEKSKQTTNATKVLYLDIMGSDGNITVQKDEFTRLCMEETQNSLYNLPMAKVCWIVLKKDKTLVRIEGNAYHLPLGSEEKVEIDPVMSDIALFDVYHEKDKVLVLLQQEGKEPISFMLQGITTPATKKKPTENTATQTPLTSAPSTPTIPTK
ncbi:MAG: prepilin-type N-terminal cleavage/methylation domain-containing protein [Sulfurovum sp.]|nr:prepilin-type N-terminal cleavage/methylation domain-containing protein [Sulfurovum sp.]